MRDRVFKMPAILIRELICNRVLAVHCTRGHFWVNSMSELIHHPFFVCNWGSDCILDDGLTHERLVLSEMYPVHHMCSRSWPDATKFVS
jgi:hypothetical protein